MYFTCIHVYAREIHVVHTWEWSSCVCHPQEPPLICILSVKGWDFNKKIVRQLNIILTARKLGWRKTAAFWFVQKFTYWYALWKSLLQHLSLSIIDQVWLYLKASYCSFSAIVFDLFSFSYNFCSRERLCCYKTKMFQCWTKSVSSMDMWMIWMKVLPLIVNILVDPYIQTNDKIQLQREVTLVSINLLQTLGSCLIFDYILY